MSSPDREKGKAALAELDKFCKRQNEIAGAGVRRRERRNCPALRAGV